MFSNILFLVRILSSPPDVNCTHPNEKLECVYLIEIFLRQSQIGIISADEIILGKSDD